MYNATLNTKIATSYLEFTNNFYTEYNILEGLKAVARIGITTQRSDGDIFYPANHTKFSSYTEEDFLRRGSYQQNMGKMSDLSGDLTLQYSKLFDKHLLKNLTTSPVPTAAMSVPSRVPSMEPRNKIRDRTMESAT